MFLLTIGISVVYSQEKEKVGKLIEKEGKYKLDYDGKEYDIDENVLTVKLKSPKALPGKNLRVIRKNRFGFFDIKVPGNKNIVDYANELKETELYEFIEFNSFGTYNALNPNDSHMGKLWHLNVIKAPLAWDITTGNSSIIVAVLDSGLDWEHEDLGLGSDTYQNIHLNTGEDAWTMPNDPSTGNGTDDDTNSLIDDWKGWNYSDNTNDSRPNVAHGTFVGGILSAKTNNGKGIAGVSGGNNSSGVGLLAYHVGDVPSSAVLDDAIEDAVANGANVIQMSLTVVPTTAINTAIQNAVDNGVIVICASGNGSSSSVSYPASNNNVIAVGAINSSNLRADFSNYGEDIDIVAPGVDIYSTVPDNKYDYNSGTSFAAPQVSATAALILSVNPDLTQGQVRNIIESTCTKVGGYNYATVAGRPNGTWDDEVGYGCVNAQAAVLKAFGGNISGPSVVCTSNTAFSLSGETSGLTLHWECSTNVLTEVSDDNSSTYVVKAKYSSTSSVGWVRVTITNDFGDERVLQKSVYVGQPAPEDIDVINVGPNYPGSMVLCEDMPNDGKVNWNEPGDILEYSWSVYDDGGTYWQVNQHPMDPFPMIPKQDVQFSKPYGSVNGYVNVIVKARNTCGWGNYSAPAMQFTTSSCMGMMLTVSPNPSNGETVISLEPELPVTETAKSTTVATFDETTEWELEVYNNMQSLKAKQTKIKTKEVKINTQSWKEGVYTVRVKYKDRVLLGKLVVKK